MFFIKIYIKKNYMNYYDTSIQMCGQYCILAPRLLWGVLLMLMVATSFALATVAPRGTMSLRL